MSPPTPTTKSLSEAIIAALAAALNQTISLLPKSFLRVLSGVIAAQIVQLYKYGGFSFLQMFVQTAVNAVTEVNGKLVNPLLAWGNLILGETIGAAVQAELVISVTSTAPGGSVLNSQEQLVGEANAVVYLTVSQTILPEGVPTSVDVRAAGDQAGGDASGSIGNLENGSILNFASPLTGVARPAAVTSTTIVGSDAETTEAYRQRVIDRFQKVPQGGAYVDYERWAEGVPDIINAFVYTSDDPGTVLVYVQATAASSGSDQGVPTQAQLDAVYDAIQLDENGLATRIPANALAQVLAILPQAFSVDIAGLVVDNPTQVKADIETGIAQYMAARSPFILGSTVPPRTDTLTAAGVSGVVDAIVSDAGGIFTDVTMTKGVTPTTSYTLGIGETAYLDDVTYS